MSEKNAAADAAPTLSDRLRTVPLLVALVPFAAGIVAGAFVHVPVYVWITAAAICVVAALLGRGRATGAVYTPLAILFFGAALMRIHTPQPVIPRGERVWMEMLITDNTIRGDGRASGRTSGVVTRWRPAPVAPVSAASISEGAPTHAVSISGAASAAATPTLEASSPAAAPPAAVSAGRWQHSAEKLLTSLDTMWHFEAGDRIVFRGYVNPVSDTATSYSRLMRSRGYTGRTHISRWSQPAMMPAGAKSPAVLIKKLQAGATERFRRLEIAPDQEAVAAAMTTGDRSGITPELRKNYSRTGASHLLAVSGLHVGIVFLLVNILLCLLPLARGGHIAKNIAAVAAIWCYAALTGLSPSAMRAAFMFTGAQAALAASKTRSAANIMCGTALVMLAVRPGLLLDISFQLSFIAVGAILAWFPPLYRLLESRRRGLNALWATLLVGLTASVATMPLVSHTFGVFSPAGIVLNPIVILTAHLVVVFSLIWIAVPAPFMEPVFRWLVGGPAWLQNRVVSLVAEVPAAAVEWTMPLWGVFAIYAAMIIFTALFYARPRKAEPFSLQQ